VIEQERQRAERAQQQLEQSGSGSCRAAAAERAQQQLEQERQLREEPLKRLQERGINLDDLRNCFLNRTFTLIAESVSLYIY